MDYNPLIMDFVLKREGGEKIILDKSFAESIAKELKDNNISTGTILLAATEFWLDPTYVFRYNKPNVVEFRGRYDIVIVANIFNSNGGRISLTGKSGGRTPRKPDRGTKGAQVTQLEDQTIVGPERGNPNPATAGTDGENGGHANSITLYCNELMNIEVFANGGRGGDGGEGGDGGNVCIEDSDPTTDIGSCFIIDGAVGADGGKGGNGGQGGNAGNIELFYCNAPDDFVITDHLSCNGGKGGLPGTGGAGGLGGIAITPDRRADSGKPGLPGNFLGNGQTLVPSVNKITLDELLQKILELESEPSGSSNFMRMVMNHLKRDSVR